MINEYYKTLIHFLKNERNSLDRRIRILEEWMNGKPGYESKRAPYTETRSEITSEAMKKSWARRKKAKRNKYAYIKRGKGAYNGTHWMQNPKNKAKMLAQVKKMSKTKTAKTARG